MPRMFDLLRGNTNRPDDKEKRSIEKDDKKNLPDTKDNVKENALRVHHVSFPKKYESREDAQNTKENPYDHVLASKKLISAIKEHGIDSQEKAAKLYQDSTLIVNNLLDKIRGKEDLNTYMAVLEDLLNRVFNQFVLGEAILAKLNEKKEEDVYYLPYHITNVLLLSCFLGIKMGFNKSKMRVLGLACLFYDTGMDVFREIVSQPRMLSQKELNLIKKHISYSLQVMEKINNIDDIVKDTIATHHERADGGGYPKGLRAVKINPYAKVIGLIDTYEAIIHNRPYRNGMHPHNAIKSLLNTAKNSFDYGAIKSFIDAMSIYPIGTLVKLDSGETARIIGAKSGSPLRPTVMIVRGPDGKALTERKVLDLSLPDTPSIIDSA